MPSHQIACSPLHKTGGKPTEQLIERSHGNLQRIWLPCIDPKNPSRRNRQSGSACWRNMLCQRLGLSLQLYRASNSPDALGGNFVTVCYCPLLSVTIFDPNWKDGSYHRPHPSGIMLS
jgi:hypothetical protein